MNIAFIGYGNVGGPLADQLQRLGHTVTLAANDPNSASVLKARARNPTLLVAAPPVAVKAAEVVFLATPYQANEAALANVAHELLGKIIVDCTNPVGPNISHGLGSVLSGSQTIQTTVPDARVVKAFTIYGFENLENNEYDAFDVKPVMMFCGNDPEAKKTVAQLIMQLGWQHLDVGGLEQALHLEHMTLMWIRMVRVYGGSPHMVWAALSK